MKKSNFFCEFFVNKNIPILPKITKKCPHLGEGCQVAAAVKFWRGPPTALAAAYRSWYRQMYIQFGPQLTAGMGPGSQLS